MTSRRNRRRRHKRHKARTRNNHHVRIVADWLEQFLIRMSTPSR